MMVVVSLEKQGIDEAQGSAGMSSLKMKGALRRLGPEGGGRTVAVSPGLPLR